MLLTRGYAKMTDEQIEEFRRREAYDSKTKNLEPFAVYCAFGDIGYTPEQHINVDTKDRRCCGMMAVHIKKGGSTDDRPESFEMMKWHGLSRNYMEGFMVGWDYPYHEICQTLSDISKSYEAGWKHGKAAWRLCATLWKNPEAKKTEESCPPSPTTRTASTS